jgi:hypothetical protein
VLLALFLLAAPPAVPLFANPAVLEALGDLRPTPGAWAEYLVRGKKGHALRVRISVLTEAAPEGRYWLELDTAAPGAPPQAARLLVHGSPTRPENIERMEIYMLGQAPIEIPIDQLQETLPRAGPAPPPKIVRGGVARVRVSAGSFDARIVEVGDTRIWRSAQVPLWGLVKGRSPRETVELLGSGGQGAHSVFPRGEPERK